MRTIILACLISCAGAALAQPAPATPASAAPPPQQGLPVHGANTVWTGDFEKLLERRFIRVLIPYSRTLFFIDKGHERGLSAELARDFERYLNKKYSKQLGKRPITLLIIPTTRTDLLEAVARGAGDIAAGNITVTEDRLKIVDFVAPEDRKPMSELVVTGPASPTISSLDDLAGKTVHVRRSSSYFSSLEALNARFKNEGKALVTLALVPDELEDEDLMEMLNAGLLQIIVVDDWKARMWSQILPGVKVHDNVKVSEGGRIGWAIRKESPELRAELEEFYRDFVKKEGVAEYRLARMMKQVKQIKNNATEAERKRFRDLLTLFERYGEKYRFDPLMLAAQGFQESQLNQDAKSHVGAIGIMQVMPTTGAELKVGDITVTEPNIHAGAKYLDQLMSRYFKDADFSGANRPLFAFASYNAGPGNIRKMRREAEKRGLDPNKWLNNVELVTAEKLGIETTTYVRNIYKYYVAYKLVTESSESARKAREQIAPAPK